MENKHECRNSLVAIHVLTCSQETKLSFPILLPVFWKESRTKRRKLSFINEQPNICSHFAWGAQIQVSAFHQREKIFESRFPTLASGLVSYFQALPENCSLFLTNLNTLIGKLLLPDTFYPAYFMNILFLFTPMVSGIRKIREACLIYFFVLHCIFCNSLDWPQLN